MTDTLPTLPTLAARPTAAELRAAHRAERAAQRAAYNADRSADTRPAAAR